MLDRLRTAPARYTGCALIVLSAAVGAAALAQQSALDDPARSADERARDAGSRPIEVFTWLGVEPGMTVADLIPGSGYNTHILARMVGETGTVHCAGTSEDGQRQLETRFADADLANVQVHQSLQSIPAGSVDVYVVVRNVHDMLIPDVAARYGMEPDPIFVEILRTLKPGGILGVVDARTTSPGVDAATHRINQETLIAEVEARGLEYVEASELLANSEDDPTSPSWGNRWHIDRMLVKFRKPSE